jgi:hypothetical protein
MSSPRNISIDGTTLTIQFLEIGEIPVKNDVYSEWKEWAQEAQNLKFPPAFDTTGGDPLTATENISAYYFIRNDLGWRIKAPELNGQLILVGDLFPRDFTTDFFLTSDGAFSNLISQVVSSKSIASFSQADLFALTGSIYIDTNNGVPGTAEGVGTPNNPVDNLADATTLAVANNIRSFVIRGGSQLTLTQAYTDWQFVGQGAVSSDSIALNGQNVDGSFFSNLTLSGSQSGVITALQCGNIGITELSGTYISCGFSSVANTFATGSPRPVVTMDSCYSKVAGNGTPTFTATGPVVLNTRNWSGGFEVQGWVDGCSGSVDLDPGHFIFGLTNTGGEMLYRGTGRRTITLGSPRPNVIDEGFHVTADTTLTRKLLQNRMVTDPVAGTITVYDDDDTTVLISGNLWEDALASQAYRGRGAERRERMV